MVAKTGGILLCSTPMIPVYLLVVTWIDVHHLLFGLPNLIT
jgi:hypothetical protein